VVYVIQQFFMKYKTNIRVGKNLGKFSYNDNKSLKTLSSYPKISKYYQESRIMSLESNKMTT